MRFDWDDEKAHRNERIHGVTFDEGASVFWDPLSIVSIDSEHSNGEVRWRRIGHAYTGRLVVVVVTERSGTMRVISARRATKRERHDYEG